MRIGLRADGVRTRHRITQQAVDRADHVRREEDFERADWRTQPEVDDLAGQPRQPGRDVLGVGHRVSLLSKGRQSTGENTLNQFFINVDMK
ncbi:hypothetical protein D3C87_1941310 [compost metagenome]